MRIKSSTDHRLGSGFTLVEALMAIAAGAFMLTALYSGLTFGIGNVKLAREDLRATQIMVQRLETVRLSGFSAVQTGTFTDYFDPTGAANGNSGAIYQITVTTNKPTASDMPVQPVYYMNQMLKVTVTATWTNANQLRTRTLQTYTSSKGIQSYVYNHK